MLKTHAVYSRDAIRNSKIIGWGEVKTQKGWNIILEAWGSLWKTKAYPSKASHVETYDMNNILVKSELSY